MRKGSDAMSPILPKKQMTEEDIKLHYITPAITAKWSPDLITMETKITDGKINLKGNLVVREKPKKADYVLYLGANQPIAIVEAKDNNHPWHLLFFVFTIIAHDFFKGWNGSTFSHGFAYCSSDFLSCCVSAAAFPICFVRLLQEVLLIFICHAIIHINEHRCAGRKGAASDQF